MLLSHAIPSPSPELCALVVVMRCSRLALRRILTGVRAAFLLMHEYIPRVFRRRCFEIQKIHNIFLFVLRTRIYHIVSCLQPVRTTATYIVVRSIVRGTVPCSLLPSVHHITNGSRAVYKPPRSVLTVLIGLQAPHSLSLAVRAVWYSGPSMSAYTKLCVTGLGGNCCSLDVAIPNSACLRCACSSDTVQRDAVCI